jgi:adenosylhomocysteinase
VTECKLQNGKTLFLLKNGEAINFLVQSCPDEVIDLIFAETIHCWKLLVDEERRYAPGRIHRTPLHITDMIAKSWLALAGVDSY